MIGMTRVDADALAERIAGEGFFVLGVDKLWNRQEWCVQVVGRPPPFGAPASLLSVLTVDEWERFTRKLAAPTGANVKQSASYYGELAVRDSALQQAIAKLQRRERHRQLQGAPKRNLGGASVDELALERQAVQDEMARIACCLARAA